MYCTNCGNLCEQSNKYCPTCGNKLNKDIPVQIVNYQNNVTTQISKKENKMANILSIISLICVFFSPGLYLLLNVANELIGIINSLVGILMLAGIALMIYVRIKYPNNIFGKVLMWLYIIMLVLYIILIIISFVACSIIGFEFLKELRNCQG